MTDAVVRRTPGAKVCRNISEILEHIDAIEYAMGTFFHKGSVEDLFRARQNFDALREQVDHLGRIIGDLAG
jgi:hypothetical protein